MAQHSNGTPCALIAPGKGIESLRDSQDAAARFQTAFASKLSYAVETDFSRDAEHRFDRVGASSRMVQRIPMFAATCCQSRPNADFYATRAVEVDPVERPRVCGDWSDAMSATGNLRRRHCDG
jgi:hypothetical protein